MSTLRSARFRRIWALRLTAVLLLSPASALSGGVPDGPGGYDQLLELFQDYQAFKRRLSPAVGADFAATAIEQRRTELR
ncbi:MAG: hypothetical protein KJO82_15585, partial [Gammaproteobacteria bacterium]|nr:hypothetical protein [Gammaproteobacteria bacterium]